MTGALLIAGGLLFAAVSYAIARTAWWNVDESREVLLPMAGGLVAAIVGAVLVWQ